MRVEIADWLFEELHKTMKQRAALFEGPPDGSDAEMDPALLEFLNTPLEDLDHGQIMALVKSLKSKKGKGRGKGGPRKCYECDADDHIACPVLCGKN